MKWATRKDGLVIYLIIKIWKIIQDEKYNIVFHSFQWILKKLVYFFFMENVQK